MFESINAVGCFFELCYNLMDLGESFYVFFFINKTWYYVLYVFVAQESIIMNITVLIKCFANFAK